MQCGRELADAHEHIEQQESLVQNLQNNVKIMSVELGLLRNENLGVTGQGFKSAETGKQGHDILSIKTGTTRVTSDLAQPIEPDLVSLLNQSENALQLQLLKRQNEL